MSINVLVDGLAMYSYGTILIIKISECIKSCFQPVQASSYEYPIAICITNSR